MFINDIYMRSINVYIDRIQFRVINIFQVCELYSRNQYLLFNYGYHHCCYHWYFMSRPSVTFLE